MDPLTSLSVFCPRTLESSSKSFYFILSYFKYNFQLIHSKTPNVVWWLFPCQFPHIPFPCGFRLEVATIEICAGFGTKGQPLLGSEDCCRAGAVELCAYCHRPAVGKEHLLGPQHLQLPSNSFSFWEPWAGGTYSSVAEDAGLSHKLPKSLGLEAVLIRWTFSFSCQAAVCPWLPYFMSIFSSWLLTLRLSTRFRGSRHPWLHKANAYSSEFLVLCHSHWLCLSDGTLTHKQSVFCYSFLKQSESFSLIGKQHWWGWKNTGFVLRLYMLPLALWHLLSMCLWPTYLISWCLSFFSYQMGTSISANEAAIRSHKEIAFVLPLDYCSLLKSQHLAQKLLHCTYSIIFSKLMDKWVCA